jgi:hypothetical protein
MSCDPIDGSQAEDFGSTEGLKHKSLTLAKVGEDDGPTNINNLSLDLPIKPMSARF